MFEIKYSLVIQNFNFYLSVDTANLIFSSYAQDVKICELDRKSLLDSIINRSQTTQNSGKHHSLTIKCKVGDRLDSASTYYKQAFTSSDIL